MASSFNEESVEKKLKGVNNTQDSIQSLSLWIIHHKSHHEKIVQLWLKVLKKTVHPSHRLTLLYLCNDVVQTCKKKKALIYASSFKEHLREAAGLVRDVSVKGKVERIFNIWLERGVYDASFIKSLQKALNGVSSKAKEKKKSRKQSKHALASAKVNKISDGQPVKVDKVSNDGPVSPPGTPLIFEEKSAEVQESEERDAEESARILAEFKPHEMIEQITTFHRNRAEIQLKVSQLTTLKLDASNLEAIKHLKDRAHGNDFSTHFEDSCTKLEDIVKRQTQHSVDQLVLLETLKTSETFYEEQYREAKIVANAYKNYGARINNMKKRLDELKKSMPDPDSPFPSPDVNAPSPGNTPPHVASAGFSYNGGNQQNNWMYGGTGNARVSMTVESSTNNTFDESPPLEAPSPDGTPPELNFGGAESTTSASFESRLASFFNESRSTESNPSLVYSSKLSTSKSYKSAGVVGDDGSNTPLDDETPTTPVQDEHLASPPKRTTPPKKENPIDFLSRLISQTNKAPAVKSRASSFLDTLSLLTNPSKASTEPTKDSSPSPQSSWSSSQPASPTQFTPSVPPPTMVPPPIPMPVPPPPMALSMGLSLPPPPPPPFTISSGGRPSLDFSNPPPGFQQSTSPGQKENWPEASNNTSPSSDLGAGARAGHNSVLKELIPADSFDSKPSEPKPSSSLLDPDVMEIVSDEEDESLADTVGDAQSEFAQKLKQKTQAGGAGLKSHVFKPNSERPNLMTLTGPEDLDEEDMIDEHTVTEDSRPSWSSKSHKSHKKSRSRSRSRERSHKHKKKKKHKRAHSDEDDDLKGSLGSVVKRIDSRSGSRGSRDSRGDKYDDRYEDRKSDKYEDRDRHRSRGSKDMRDPVEAYTQAYRNAMFQQMNQSHFSSVSTGSRHSSYNKY